MWKIFQTSANIVDSLNSITKWKEEVFQQMDIKLRTYFAEKVVVYFDNMMISQSKRGIHENLLESLSRAEKEMQQSHLLFKDIKCFWLPENTESILVTLNLPDEQEFSPQRHGFSLVQDDAIPMEGKKEKLQNLSWETLVFSVDLSNFATSWINHTPSQEERSKLQAKHLLLTATFKKKDFSLLEKLQFEENIENHPQFHKLYEKVLRIMPKIESSLEQEWKSSITQGWTPQLNIKRNKTVK